ncbi:2202_t:CDS:1, partial [Dentiscutata erythropus]
PVDESTFLRKDSLQPLLQNFQEMYQNWPKIQQKAAQETLTNQISIPMIVLQDPVVVSTREHPSGFSKIELPTQPKEIPPDSSWKKNEAVYYLPLVWA